MVRAQRADSSIVEGIASGEPHPVVGNAWLWSSVPKWHAGHIVKRYRLRKPRALLDLIEMVENLPAPVAPMVMA